MITVCARHTPSYVYVCVCAILLIPIKPIGPICPRYLHAVRQFKFSFKTLGGWRYFCPHERRKIFMFFALLSLFLPDKRKTFDCVTHIEIKRARKVRERGKVCGRSRMSSEKL